VGPEQRLPGGAGGALSAGPAWCAAASFLAAACATTGAAPPGGSRGPARSFDEASHLAAFHTARLEKLRAPDGWLTLVGLIWLGEGESRVGSAEPLRLPERWPAKLGVFSRHGEQASFKPAPGVAVAYRRQPFAGGAIEIPEEGESDPLVVGDLRLTVIRRGDRLGLRLRDPASPARAALHDIPTYPADPQWRIVARFEPAPPGHVLPVENVLGMVQATPSPGIAIFRVEGKVYRLSPTMDDPDHLFFVFGDLTNRDSTDGTGRFLTTELPSDGLVVLDFNEAINPPCAFTPYATCPIPPKENRLPIRVEAGELRVPGH